MPVSPSHSHKRSNSGSGGGFPSLSSSSSRPPSSSTANASAAPPLRSVRSFTPHQQYSNQVPQQALSNQNQQQQRRRANYRAAPPQSPKPHHHDNDDRSHSHSHSSSHNAPPSPGRRSVFSSSGGGLFKASSFDDCYNNNSQGYSDAFALLGHNNNSNNSNNPTPSSTESTSTGAAPFPSSPSRRKRFFPASPKKTPSGMRSPVPPSFNNPAKQQEGTASTSAPVTPSNLFMPNFSNNNNNSGTASVATNCQPPLPSTAAATRSSSPSVNASGAGVRSSSPLTLKMKQSLPWSKKHSSSTGRQRPVKGTGNYSDAVNMALHSDQEANNVVVEEASGEVGMEVVSRLRTRSPSPVRYLGGTMNANHRKTNTSNSSTSNKNKSNHKTAGSSSVNLLASKYSRDENEDDESNAPSSAAPSFFNNRNIHSMSPARLKMSLKQRILEKVPSSPRRDYHYNNQKNNNANNPSLSSSGQMDEDYTDGMVAKFSGASMSFELEDDYEIAHINSASEQQHPPHLNASPEQQEQINSSPKEFIINTTTYNIFENTLFLQAMGGSNDASLATNYIRTGDSLSSKGIYDRALSLYYAGLGAILSRIRRWIITSHRQQHQHQQPTTPTALQEEEEYNLVYQDFAALAKSTENNVLLLAMASILLRAGNANFSLARFETACRDYVSAQSYRSLHQQQTVGNSGINDVPSLVGKSQEERNLLLEDWKLNGRISNNVACAQTKRKMYEEARAEYTKALQIKQKTLEKVHEDISSSSGTALENTDANVKNNTDFGTTIQLKDDDLVSDIASTFHNIGLLRVNCDEPIKAEKAFKQSLSLRVKKFGLDDLGVSSTLCALGDVYFHQKRYDDAFRSYKESLRIWKFHRGSDCRTAELYYNIGLVFYSKGPYAKAKMAVVECLRIRREQCGDGSLLVASSLQLLGLIFMAMGDQDDALIQLQEALATRQQLLGKTLPNHLLIHNVHLAIGKAYSSMGEFDKAMESFSIVLMGRTIRLGKHHPLVAEVLQAIGEAYMTVNEYSKAAETLEEALRIRRSLLGPSMELAETLNSLSMVYFCCDDSKHAIELSEQSLKILKNAVGFDHSLVAKVLKNAGDYKQNVESLDEAIEDYTESLRIMTAWKGRDHISLSELLNEIGVTYFKKEEYVLAKESFTESLRIMRLSDERTDKSVIFPTLSHLGHALFKNKELDTAAETYLESFKIQVSIVTGEECDGLADFSNSFGVFRDGIKAMVIDDEDVAALSEALAGIASILRYLGLVRHAQGDPELALTVNKLSLSVRLCQPLREHSAIAVMAETIAMFEFKQNNLNSALEYFNQALEAKKSVQGESTIDVARTVNNLANIHFSLGNLDDAMKLYQEALEIKKHCLGEDSDDVANTLNNIAHVMVTAGKDQDALETYHNVLKIRQDKYGKNHISVAATLASMGDVYIKLGKLEIAMTYLEQVLRIRNLQKESRDERIMENLASIYGKLGEWQKAETAFKEILLLKRASYGNDCLDLAKTLDLLAVSYIEQDRCVESIEHLQEALRIRKVCLGGDDDEVLASLNKLAFVYKTCNMTDKMLEVKAEFDSIQASRKH